MTRNLCEVISVFDGEQFLELVVDNVSVTSHLFTCFVLATLHTTDTQTTIQSAVFPISFMILVLNEP